MDDYRGSLARYWLTEEEDDDIEHYIDDEEEEVAAYEHLVQGESSRLRRRGPPKVIRLRVLPFWG